MEMNNLENIIVEFALQKSIGSYAIFIALILIFLKLFLILLKKLKEKKTEEHKKKTIHFIVFLLLVVFLVVNGMFLKSFLNKYNSIEDFNNKYNNIVVQEENDTIEIHYISTLYKNLLEAPKTFKTTIQKTEDEKYYVYFNEQLDNKKEIKKENIKETLENIKKHKK